MKIELGPEEPRLIRRLFYTIRDEPDRLLCHAELWEPKYGHETAGTVVPGLGEEARELLEMLGRVEKYIKYLDMRASGHTYMAFGLATACGALATFLVTFISELIGVPCGIIIGLIWFIVIMAALMVSGRHWGRAEALALARKPPEERERLRKQMRTADLILTIGWIGSLSLWGLSFYFLFDHPGQIWALYTACVGLGNLITYLSPGGKAKETLYVALSLMASSPLVLATALASGWAPFVAAIIAVVLSYLWASLRFYRKAEAILAGAEG